MIPGMIYYKCGVKLLIKAIYRICNEEAFRTEALLGLVGAKNSQYLTAVSKGLL